jgi:hypothetical protein
MAKRENLTVELFHAVEHFLDPQAGLRRQPGTARSAGPSMVAGLKIIFVKAGQKQEFERAIITCALVLTLRGGNNRREKPRPGLSFPESSISICIENDVLKKINHFAFFVASRILRRTAGLGECQDRSGKEVVG